KGRDIQQQMTISFEEAAFGTKKTIKLTKYVECPDCKGTGAKKGTSKKTCPECGGSGEVYTAQRTPFGTFQTARPCHKCNGTGEIIETPCETCHGAGRIRKTVTLNVKIPEGVDNDSVITLRGEGEPGTNGGPAGNLYLILNVKPHKMFERHGADIALEIPISFDQAALGDSITVPTLKEKIKYKVPAGTQPGTMFRIKGHGIPNGRGKNGDLYVKVFIEIPTKLSTEQKKAIKNVGEVVGPDAYSKKSKFIKGIKDLFK
ncbi:MAG: DnaJ C-terminal domain-containing protein, partial [Anaerovoracaceae bacterium]